MNRFGHDKSTETTCNIHMTDCKTHNYHTLWDWNPSHCTASEIQAFIAQLTASLTKQSDNIITYFKILNTAIYIGFTFGDHETLLLCRLLFCLSSTFFLFLPSSFSINVRRNIERDRTSAQLYVKERDDTRSF